MSSRLEGIYLARYDPNIYIKSIESQKIQECIEFIKTYGVRPNSGPKSPNKALGDYITKLFANDKTAENRRLKIVSHPSTKSQFMELQNLHYHTSNHYKTIEFLKIAITHFENKSERPGSESKMYKKIVQILMNNKVGETRRKHICKTEEGRLLLIQLQNFWEQTKNPNLDNSKRNKL